MKITHATYLVSNELIAKEFLSNIFGFVVIEEGVAIDGKKFLALGESGGVGLQIQVIETHIQGELSRLRRTEGIVDFIVEVTDVHACCKKVVDFGLFVKRDPVKAAYGITAIFEDPFGNLWDLVQRNTPK